MRAPFVKERVVARDRLGTAPVRHIGRALEPGKRRGSKSQFARLCSEIDNKIESFLARRLDRVFPYLRLDATYVKVHEAGRIAAVTATVALNNLGRRVVSAFVAKAFARDDAEMASALWRLLADHLGPQAPGSATKSMSGPLTNVIKGRAHAHHRNAPHGTSAVVNIHEPPACGHPRLTL